MAEFLLNDKIFDFESTEYQQESGIAIGCNRNSKGVLKFAPPPPTPACT